MSDDVFQLEEVIEGIEEEDEVTEGGEEAEGERAGVSGTEGEPGLRGRVGRERVISQTKLPH